MLAAVVGALSPFCSCGVIPLIAAMLRAGVPLAPVMAFWLASPIMDPEMFVLTAAGVGLGFARSPRPWRPWPWGCSAVSRCVRSRTRRRIAESARGGGGRDVRRRLRPAGGGVRPVALLGETSTGGIASFVNRCTPAPFSSSGLSVAFLAESLMMAWLPAESVAAVVGGGNAFAIPSRRWWGCRPT